jgi:Family of unknown function (DUF6364)
MQAKLTLSVDPSVIRRAKRYAKQQGTSVSQMVETYLASATKPPATEGGESPGLRALSGILKGVDPEDYRRHLVKKYL